MNVQPFYHDFQFDERIEDTNAEGEISSAPKQFGEVVKSSIEVAGDQLLFTATDDVSEVVGVLANKGIKNFVYEVEPGDPHDLM